MIRMAFALVVTFALLLGGALWFAGDLEPDGGGRATTPRLHTIDLQELLDSAFSAKASRERGTGRVSEPGPTPPEDTEPAPPSVAEDVLPEPAPFVEAPLPDPAVDAKPPAELRDPPLEAEPAPVVVAARDQDAWAALIRRMLALHRRAAAR